MSARICIDASVALMLLLPHELSARVKSLWCSWAESEIEIVTAPLFFSEVTSVLRENVFFKHMLAEEGERAFSAYMELPVKAAAIPDLQLHAWNSAKKFNRPKAYDAQYLAVASVSGCQLFTGDIKLVNAVRQPWVRWVGDH